MNIGRTSPRFNDFGVLYSGSVRLQKALCDYYAAVIRVCKQALDFFQTTAISQLSSTFLRPFKITFGPLQQELESLALAVRDETSLASKQAQDQEAKLQTIERQEAGRERNLLSRFRDRTRLEQEEADKWRTETRLRASGESGSTLSIFECLLISDSYSERKRLDAINALSPYNYSMAWKRARRQCLVGTSTWIYDSPSFKSWIRCPDSATLCCVGKCK